MATFHFSGKVHSRLGDTANNAVRAAAYRAGCILEDVNGNLYNYTKKTEVKYCEIFAPKNAPAWVFDRSKLWNKVEETEKRVDAQLFREFEAALPHELSFQEKVNLVREFANTAFTSIGMVCDAGFHLKPNNEHVHMSLTMRDINKDGFGKKNRDWNDKALVEKWRKLWADTCNKYLELAGSEKRIDHRSYKDQGLDIEPSVHLGPKHSKTYESRVARNNNIKEYNEGNIILSSMRAQLAEVENEAKNITRELKDRESAKLVRAKFLNELRSVAEKGNATKILAVNPSNIIKLEGIQCSKSTSLAIYEPPKIAVDRFYFFDGFPTRGKDQQACFALRELLGSDAEKEYRNRVKMLNLVGGKYTWARFYADIQDFRNKPTGAYESWWRMYARMAFNTHNDTFNIIRSEAPKEYLKYIDSEVIKEVPKNRVEQAAYNHDLINQMRELCQDAKVDNKKKNNYSGILNQIHDYLSKNKNKSAPQHRRITETPKPELAPDVPPQQHDVVAPAYYNPYPDPYAIPDAPRPPWGSDTPSSW